MTNAQIDQSLDTAVAHHQAGRLSEAEQIYRQILQSHPHHAQALQNLGVLHHQRGQHDIAIDLIRSAISSKPDWIDPHLNLGKILCATGRLDDSIPIWRQAIAMHPDVPELYSNLSSVLKELGQLDESISVAQQAVSRWPNSAEAYNNLGIALKAKGQLDLALAAYQEAIQCSPELADAHINLGSALLIKGNLDQAAIALRRAIHLRPHSAEAFYNLALVLKDKKDLPQAIAACQRAIALKPDFAEAHGNLGSMLMETEQIEEAMVAFLRATQLRPNFAEGYSNLGVMLANKGRLEEAIALLRKAIAIRPDFAEAHLNLSSALMENQQTDEGIAEAHRAAAAQANYGDAHINLATIHLIRGDLLPGWEEYEWRFRCLDSPPQTISQPRWTGEPLPDQILLLQTEQGLGDTIQFIRYWPQVLERVPNTIIQCQPALKSLLERNISGCQIVSTDEPLPPFDFYCPILSLPRVFRTELSTIPAPIPYLRAERTQSAEWRRRFAELSSSKNIGIAWRGNPQHKNDRNRSMRLSKFAPLSDLQQFSFINLQKHDPLMEAKNSPLPLIDWTAELRDFTDTAALIDNLDLIISVDTSIIHLAGAMGKPVWLLLPLFPDWRWLLERPDSPWYPTMRLFRQTARGDWNGVIARVADALAGWNRTT